MGPGGGKDDVSPANNLCLFSQLWAARSALLLSDFSPGLFALNEGPKSHCPVV